MKDEELIARLHLPWPKDESVEEVTLPAWVLELTAEAADRIEALVKERDEALEWLSASQGYIADAVFALDKQEKAEARAERLEAAIHELKRCWYQGDLTENDFAAALKGDDQ